MVKQIVPLFVALICAILFVQADCLRADDFDDFYDENSYGELWHKLNNKELSVSEVDAILEAVPDKDETMIGKISVAKMLELKDLSLDKCQVDKLRMGNYDQYRIWTSKIDTRNEGAYKFAKHYFDKLIEQCLAHLEEVVATAVARIDDKDKKILKIFAGKPSSKESLDHFVRKQSESYIRSWSESGKMSKDATLEGSCERVSELLSVVKEIDYYSGKQVVEMDEADLLKDWYQIKQACEKYKFQRWARLSEIRARIDPRGVKVELPDGRTRYLKLGQLD